MAQSGLVRWVQRPETWAGLTAVAFAAVFVTPYCGYLFECGCTWPWAGLDAHCNIHDAYAEHRCPWCASLPAGGLSMLAILGLSYAAATHPLGNWTGALEESSRSPRSFAVFASGFLNGIVAFLIAGFVTAWLAALWTGYPTFVVAGMV